MEVKIFLDIDSYDCLLKNVPRQAPSRAAINAAVRLGNTMIVECAEAEARALMVIARSRCPSVVASIADAIRSPQ